MSKKRYYLLISALLIFSAVAPGASSGSVETDAAAIIRDDIGTRGSYPELYIEERIVQVTDMLQRFYRSRNYMPAWSAYGGPFSDLEDLIDAVREAYKEGLNPDDYPIEEMIQLAAAHQQTLTSGEAPDPAAMAKLDILATDTFLSYAYHLLAGRIYPEITDGEWSDLIWVADLDGLLHDALEDGNVRAVLKSLAPPHGEYTALRDALAFYREIAAVGGWPGVPYGRTLRQGDSSRRVASLRSRLVMSGDLDYDYETSDENFFDEELMAAVLRFQRRHGLLPDGIVGHKTLTALNVPIEDRIEQIELNMERWRWLPEDLGDRYIFVNTAAFEMKVVEHGVAVMRMKIVVGKPYWHTPSFSSKMTYIVVNPSWNVPTSIAIDDILPKLAKNTKFLETRGFKIIVGSGKNAKTVDPKSIEWSKVTEDNISFRFVQAPGPGNPLGRIKFMFPNRFSVYLHDTPSKGLFERTIRTFSHGCIRIEKPVSLAAYLIPDLDDKALDELFEQNEETTVRLPEPIMVHTLYWTAWVDDDGAINFRDDIYGRDEALMELLSYGPMTP